MIFYSSYILLDPVPAGRSVMDVKFNKEKKFNSEKNFAGFFLSFLFLVQRIINWAYAKWLEHFLSSPENCTDL